MQDRQAARRDSALQLCSTYGHHPNPKITFRTYEGEIDAFGVYCPETQHVYLVPIADATTHRRCGFELIRRATTS